MSIMGNRTRSVGRQTWEGVPTDYATSWRDIRWFWRGPDSGHDWITRTYQLEYRVYSPGDTPDTGWYLYGPDGSPFGEYMSLKLAEAMIMAREYIFEHCPRCRTCDAFDLVGAYHADYCVGLTS